jgi:hypothetical protein
VTGFCKAMKNHEIDPMKTEYTLVTISIAGVALAFQIAAVAGPVGSEIPGGGAQGEPIPARGAQASAPTGTNAAGASAAPLNATAAANAINTNSFVGFDKLAGFRLDLSPELEFTTNRTAEADAQINALIPTNVVALNGLQVSVKGFMVPMEFDKSKVILFMLVRDPPACCFGGMPNVHEFVEVSVKPPGTAPLMYEPILARGILHVGARRVASSLTGVYRMEAETVGVAP